MKLRVAQKILKNQDNLKYAKHQIKKAKTIVGRYERNLKAEGEAEKPTATVETPAPEVENKEPQEEKAE